MVRVISEIRKKFVERMRRKRPVGMKFTKIGRGWKAKKRGLI
jgi:hypothetical protein